jgi:AcrR family transcriptional regulator
MAAPLKSHTAAAFRTSVPENPAVGRAPAADELLARARRQFLKEGRCDIEALAAELGISRATAYRWAGNTEQLLGNVIASLTEATFRRACQQVRSRGAARVVAIMERGMRAVLDLKVYREFLARDPQKSLRIVASKEGPSQQRAIALHQELLEEEISKGNLDLPVDAHTMAYALVRTAESFLYADLVAGEEPDVDKAVKILRLMLR